MNATRVFVREAGEDDLKRIAELAGQLGYPTTADEVRERLSLIKRETGKHAVLVAVLSDQRVTGWVHAMIHLSLATESRVEVAGLVVDEHERGKGIGRCLMNAVESWAQNLGAFAIRLSSQTKRVEAHRFYEGLGYEINKTSHVLAKQLQMK